MGLVESVLVKRPIPLNAAFQVNADSSQSRNFPPLVSTLISLLQGHHAESQGANHTAE